MKRTNVKRLRLATMAIPFAMALYLPISTAADITSILTNPQTVTKDQLNTAEQEFARGASHLNLDRLQDNSAYNNLARANLNIGNSCGSFSPKVAIASSFNMGNLTSMFDGIISNAKGAVMGLASRLIQEANPGLFKYLQHGVDVGFSDYLSSLKSCEGIQNLLVDNTPKSVMSKLAMGDKLSSSATPNTNIDITSFMKSKELRNGNSGVKGVDGQHYGGSTTPPLKVVTQTVTAGWCMLTHSSNGSCNGIVTTGHDHEMPVLKKVFPTPLDAETFAHNIIGEVSMRSCEGCEAVKAIPPQTISQLIDSEKITALHQLTDIAENQALDQIKARDLANISTQTYPITRSMFINLHRENSVMQAALLNKIASELATARVLDKVILLRQVLNTGLSNSKLMNNEVMQKEAKLRVQELDQVVANYQQELKMRATNSTVGREISNGRAMNHDSQADLSVL